jgi:hypothetical protein
VSAVHKVAGAALLARHWGFGRYKFQHEPIFYAHVAGQKDSWYGDKSQSTLWQERKPAATGDEVIMSIAGHVSRAMLSRYSHVRMEAKRRALDEIAARQRAADEKRMADGERPERAAIAPESAVVQ